MLVPVPMTEIISALEREQRHASAAMLKTITGWQKRTLMCEVDLDRSSDVMAIQSDGEGK